ncbi:MAG TPA: hypothetical protein VEL28_16020 [Candidatus Binatia bacterium]|nr:hypothetical protein [Candidatus Binatia bacterium]
MAQDSANSSGYDKNIRSLLEAIGMLERESSALLERLGVDGETFRRGLELMSVMSAELAGQLANALGLARTEATDSLARDVRALLEQVARLRRNDSDHGQRLQRLEQSIARLEGAASAMARLQGKTQAVMTRLQERSEAFEEVLERRQQQLDALQTLRGRIEALEVNMSEKPAATPLVRARAAIAIRSVDLAAPEAQESGETATARAKPVAR